MIPAGRFVCRNISGYKTNLFKLIHFYMNGIGLVFFDLDSTPRAFLPVLDILVILLFFERTIPSRHQKVLLQQALFYT